MSPELAARAVDALELLALAVAKIANEAARGHQLRSFDGIKEPFEQVQQNHRAAHPPIETKFARPQAEGVTHDGQGATS